MIVLILYLLVLIDKDDWIQIKMMITWNSKCIFIFYTIVSNLFTNGDGGNTPSLPVQVKKQETKTERPRYQNTGIKSKCVTESQKWRSMYLLI